MSQPPILPADIFDGRRQLIVHPFMWRLHDEYAS